MTWAPASLRLWKSHPLLHFFSQIQNTGKQHGMVSVTPVKLNARPIHSWWKPTGILWTDPGPPRYTTTHPLESHWSRTEVFAWLHTVLLVRMNNQRRSNSQVASSLAYLEQASANRVYFRSSECKKKYVACHRWLANSFNCKDPRMNFVSGHRNILQFGWFTNKSSWASSPPSHTHIRILTDTYCCIFSHLKRYHILQVDLIDVRCLWALPQVQNRATKEENPPLMCSSMKEESSNF